jgi:Fic family protein
VQKSHALRLLKAWVQQGALARQGKGRGAHYLAKPAAPGGELPARLQLALRLAGERGRITRQEYEREAHASARTAKRDLGELVRSGHLRVEGAGRLTAYVPTAGGLEESGGGGQSGPR